MTTDLPKLARAIAHCSGFLRYAPYEDDTRNQWSARLNYDSPDDHRAVWLSTSRVATGRLSIGGIWPDDPRGGVLGPRDQLPRASFADARLEITVALTRPPKIIAREIVRRLWPDYSRLYALLVERRDAILADIARREAAADELCALFPDAQRSPNPCTRDSMAVYLPGIHRADTYDGVTWRIDHLQCSTEQLKQLAVILTPKED